MNLIDALNSGLPIKRRGENAWMASHLNLWKFSAEDVLADDWEIRSEPRRVWLYGPDIKRKIPGDSVPGSIAFFDSAPENTLYREFVEVARP